MLPLIRMTWAINRRLLLGFSPVLVFYLGALLKAQSVSGTLPRPFAFIFLCIAGLVTLIVTFQGLTLEVEGFLLSLPVTRPQVVRTKYLTCLLGLVGGVALPMATAWVAHFLVPSHLPAPSSEALRTVALAALLFASGIFLFLPFIHHFGASRGFLFFALTLLLVPSAGLAWKGLDGADAVFTILHQAVGQPSLALGIGLGVLAFGLASLQLSIWSYGRRAF